MTVPTMLTAGGEPVAESTSHVLLFDGSFVLLADGTSKLKLAA